MPQIKKDFQFLKQRKWIHNSQTKQIFKIEAQTRPSAKNCVYLIQCATCNMWEKQATQLQLDFININIILTDNKTDISRLLNISFNIAGLQSEPRS